METNQLQSNESSNTKLNIKAALIYVFGFLFLPVIIYLILFAINPLTEENEMLYGAITNFFVYFLLTIALIRLFYRMYKEKLKLYLSNFFENTLLAFGVWFALMILLGIVSGILQALGINDSSQNQEAIESMILNYWYLVVPFTCIFAPIVEETIFRKVIFDFFGEKSVILAFTVSSLLFGSIHVMAELTNGLENAILILPYVTMGLGLSAVYYYTKNIWFAIITHSIQNTFAVIALLISSYFL